MPALPLLILTALAAYLIGSLPFGYLVGRARGVDVRTLGSGNIGATNVGRVLGRWWGVLVFALDFAKGAAPVALAGLLPAPGDFDLWPDVVRVTAGVAAFLGHLFPVYLGFRGGKGVATGLGIVAVLVPFEAGLIFLAWAVVLATARIMSLASLTSAGLLCVLRLTLTPRPFDPTHLVITLFCLVGVALVFLRHQGNIRRLVQGTEPRL